MSHDHEHQHSDNRVRLTWAIGIVSAILVIEALGAWISGSLALLADAGHVLSDLIGLIVALVATIIAARPPTDRQTYGFRRAEVFGALINGLILLVVAVVVTIGAVGRLFSPSAGDVHSLPMLVVASIGLVANACALLVLRSGATESINLRGAYLEVIGDAFGAIAVIVAAVLIMTTGFVQADAIASLVIAAMIAPRAVSLLRDVTRVLSEAAPPDTDVTKIREHILGTPGVVAVHDVHVWAITSGSPVFSAHVVVSPDVFRDGRTGVVLDELGECLIDHFDVAHSTFQLEPAEHAGHEGDVHS